ncbi:hypothetical protein TWF106_001102 [Orbilia oligospora]|uniref:RecA family profile 1 domain-containing protein n=1 Tax=Orbilia oligospora TaxID=2813651 RepID=A0A6G1LUU6_ORBOL|nr:hypothetical protein TWF788_010163 [Orbilia oligospora]KAF3198840.1 hypothetical protein TWF191_004760 [Orbilia oligospora]KAF3205464.1 hypothetical protein TWF106_001102 [Orbilia oligospora]KAF3235105.1 hypothetical protein TWF192_001071 [Orbilia oligospora]
MAGLILNMDPPSSADNSRHRLPTQSAAAALATQLDQGYGSFATGSEALDSSWGGAGLERGKLVEICGPPGSGKTTIAVQLVVDAVSKGEQVCWIDTLSQCPTSRLEGILTERDLASKASSILRYQITSLAHFFAIIAHLTKISLEISLVIIDDISLLFTKEFPPASDAPQSQTLPNRGHEKQIDKRGRLVADIANQLQRFSASRMAAVVVLNQLATKAVRGGGPLELAPSVHSATHSWAHAFHHRILLLRKYIPKTDPRADKRHLRFIFVLKSLGVDIQNTNLSRPDQFFVIRVTKNGVEDEKQQIFEALTGAISMAESFATSGGNSEEHYGIGFSDSEEEPEVTPLPGRYLKRKRSSDTASDSESHGNSGANVTNGAPGEKPDDDYSSDTVDLVPVPEVLAGSGTEPFPILSQARDSGLYGEAMEGSEAKTLKPVIPQIFGRTIVPDSDGESDDDVL